MGKLIFEPERFFEKLKEDPVEVKGFIIPAVIVCLTGFINPLVAFYLRGKVSLTFTLYSVLTSIIGWFAFSFVVCKISEVLSGGKKGSFLKLLLGLGVSRFPMLIFLCVMAIVSVRHNLNITSSKFAMIYVISSVWMFYLYSVCVSKIHRISFTRSVLSVALSFLAMITIMFLVSRVLNMASLSIPI